jgi:hypothetical protein
MNALRLSEILLSLIAARARSPWQSAPRHAPEGLSPRRRRAGPRPGGRYARTARAA